MNWLWYVIAIEGKLADRIRNNQPSILSPILVFWAAMIYGLTKVYYSVVLAADDGVINAVEALFYVVVAYMLIIASQLGLTMLTWSMAKPFGSQARFMQFFINTGYTFLPYGGLLALNTYRIEMDLSLVGTPHIGLSMLALFAYFLYLVVRVVGLTAGFTMARAATCVTAICIFVGSFIYLFGY